MCSRNEVERELWDMKIYWTSREKGWFEHGCENNMVSNNKVF